MQVNLHLHTRYLSARMDMHADNEGLGFFARVLVRISQLADAVRGVACQAISWVQSLRVQKVILLGGNPTRAEEVRCVAV